AHQQAHACGLRDTAAGPGDGHSVPQSGQERPHVGVGERQRVGKLTRVESSGRGAGLFTMKERVKLVGGECKVESDLGRGTRVVVRVPVTTDSAYEDNKGTHSG
ncbi:MAG: ATP-binding protein, partial [Chloroflexota bacterium]|nr:ATP-binding protein [Chloroflexota bacterium]